LGGSNGSKLNDRFGAEFNETDRLFLEQLEQDGANNDEIVSRCFTNLHF